MDGDQGDDRAHQATTGDTDPVSGSQGGRHLGDLLLHPAAAGALVVLVIADRVALRW